MPAPLIALFTDFGLEGPYVGQMKAVLISQAPGVPVIDLFADAPLFDPFASAYLLHAYTSRLPAGSVCLCVVDPGVGGPRDAAVLLADGRWYVGPDNGLFNQVASLAKELRWWRLPPAGCEASASFHGRDHFAPAAAAVARGDAVFGEEVDARERIAGDWPRRLDRVIYLDRYGNAITGIRGDQMGEGAVIKVGFRHLRRVRTFSDALVGTPFWYENSNGLVEIAVNQGSAERMFGLEVGSEVEVVG